MIITNIFITIDFVYKILNMKFNTKIVIIIYYLNNYGILLIGIL